MAWILIGTFVVSVLATAPTLYTIFGRHIGFADIGTLWRFGPHQFFFTLFVAPFTACFTGCALWWTVTAARASDLGGIAETFANNWPIAFLWPIALGAFIAGGFYIGITWSPDKLKTTYAKQAAVAIKSVEAHLELHQLNADEPSVIAAARSTASREATYKSTDLPKRLPTLAPLVQLQIFFSGKLQRSLRLTDEPTTSLSGLQVWIVLSTGIINLMCAAMILLLSQRTHIPVVASALDHARLAALCALASLLLYSYLFSAYRQEIERVAGPGVTNSQDIVSAIGVGLCFLLIVLSVEKKLSWAIVPGALGLTAVLAQFIGASRTELFRTLFGWDTRPAIQLALVPAIVIMGMIAAYAARPQALISKPVQQASSTGHDSAEPAPHDGSHRHQEHST